jgi:predicted transport protein
MLIIDGVKYKLLTPKDEEGEFHPTIKEHSKEIFGENSLYFDVKHKLKSKSGIASIPDAYVITLSKPYEWYIVENELSTHPVYSHIVPQISKFISGIDNLRSQREIRDILYKEITQDKVLKASVEKMIHPQEIHHFLSSMVSKSPEIAIIIDEVTAEVREASKALKKLGEIELVEFKTFVREDAPNVRAHLFKPLYVVEKITRKGGKKGKKEIPEYYKSWEKKLEWVHENINDVAKVLTNNILELDGVIHKPSGPDYVFYKGKPSIKSVFAGFFLTKKALKVRIRTDSATFRDTRKWTGEKVYHWFFRTGQEKEFKITERDQIDYAMELIKQSYEMAR